MTNKEKQVKTLVLPIALVMFVLTIVNLAWTYLIVKQNEYNNFWGKENYEKAMLVSKAQYDQAFKNTKKEDLEKQVKEAIWWEQVEKNTSKKIEKEDLVANTPIYGKADAKFSIYEFSDLECPYCQWLHKSGLLKQAVDKNPENLNYIYRNFQFHQWAPMKAQAALCMVDLKWEEWFFKMLDSIFSGNLRETKEDILKMWEELWAPRAELESCIDSWKYEEKIMKDYSLWEKIWVTWTPSVFVVNNETWEFKRLEGRSIEAIESLMK